MKLSTARVFVRDIHTAKHFYAQLLGLPLKADGSAHGYCVFGGATDLVIEVVATGAPQDEQVLVGRFTGLSFAVQDVQAKYDELSAAGVSFCGLPERQVWGGILATFSDPSGNELQIVQQPVA